MLSVELVVPQEEIGLAVRKRRDMVVVTSAVSPDRALEKSESIFEMLTDPQRVAGDRIGYILQHFSLLKGVVVVANGRPNSLFVAAGGDLSAALSHTESCEMLPEDETQHVMLAHAPHTLRTQEFSAQSLAIKVGHFSCNLRRSEDKRLRRIAAQPADFRNVMTIRYQSQ